MTMFSRLRPGCIRRADPALVRDLVRELGVLAFYASPVEGFSLRALCAPEVFDVNDQKTNPWYWREQILSEDIVYGQFFGGKLGFIRRDLFPLVLALKRGRRNSAELFEAELLDERALRVDRAVPAGEAMDIDAIREMLPEGFKGTSAAASLLQHAGLWVVRDFQQRRNRRGEPYGWPLCVFGRPEEHGIVDLETVPVDEGGVAGALSELARCVRRIAPTAADEAVLGMFAVKPIRKRRTQSAGARKSSAASGRKISASAQAGRVRRNLLEPIDLSDPVMADAVSRHAVEGMVLGE